MPFMLVKYLNWQDIWNKFLKKFISSSNVNFTITDKIASIIPRSEFHMKLTRYELKMRTMSNDQLPERKYQKFFCVGFLFVFFALLCVSAKVKSE